MFEALQPFVFLAVMIGGLVFGLRVLNRRVLASARRASFDAARTLSLRAEAMLPERAAEVFGLPLESVLSEVLFFQGRLSGTTIVMGTFRHASNTSFNGAPVPIVSTHVAATVERPMSGGVLIRRRVFGMPESAVSLDPSVASEVLVEAESPAELARFLGPHVELQRAIAAFVGGGVGLASVESGVVRTVVTHRDAARIVDAAKRCAQLAHEIAMASGGQAYRNAGQA